jgi:XapX domain-containing protein
LPVTGWKRGDAERVVASAGIQEAKPMKPYLLSLGTGLLVGIIYALLKVRSPAPPVIALVGLFGMLAGEQIVPIVPRLIHGEGLGVSWGERVSLEASAEIGDGRSPTSPPTLE